MYLDAATADALTRIEQRANDVLEAYTPGARARFDDTAAPAKRMVSDDPLTVALPEDAYLVVADEGMRRAYTRDGALAVVDGTLRTADGSRVMGFPSGDPRGALPVPLRVDPRDLALHRVDDQRITPDGAFSYARAAIDPRTGKRNAERVLVGRIALARFPAGTRPIRLDTVRVASPDGVVPHIGAPADGDFGVVRANVREGGAIDLNAGLARLSEAYLSLEALAASQRAQRGLEKTAEDIVK